MKTFCFTVDDNIRCLKELNEGDFSSIFEHPYLGVYRRLHDKYDLKIQLNLFYEAGDFNLSRFTDKYRGEWAKNADWLKLSFHARAEKSRIYESSDYAEVFDDLSRTNREIIRFASESALARTTTIHYCLATEGGIRAVRECGLIGLLGLYGTPDEPRSSYTSDKSDGDKIRRGEIAIRDGIAYSGVDIVLNSYSKEENLARLEELSWREHINVMIHEQYFYPDYPKYQSDFEEKLDAVFALLAQKGARSMFFEERIGDKEI
ncbi:MAG: hypothetical protein J6A83_00345 [Clostridia bacterium]|nr:hypothetical protein [Clostridia bacterium]